MVQSGSLTMRTTIKVGGAIIVSDSKVWINGTQFEGNSAELGGTLFIERSSNVSIQNSLFHFHSTRPTYYYHKSGGMIYALEISLNISSCFFVANTAQSKGAVLYTVKDDFTIIINSTFMNNTVTSGRGGVIYSTANGSFYVVSSTFTGNTATSYTVESSIIQLQMVLFVLLIVPLLVIQPPRTVESSIIQLQVVLFILSIVTLLVIQPPCMAPVESSIIQLQVVLFVLSAVTLLVIQPPQTVESSIIIESAADGFFHIVHSNFTDNTATLSGGGHL